MTEGVWIGLLVGFCLIGPVVGWLAGLGNPVGFLGVLPWRVPESARAADREDRIWTTDYHQRYEAEKAARQRAEEREAAGPFVVPADTPNSVIAEMRGGGLTVAREGEQR